ncbi:hypothetical protein [Brucella anthropi]|uniref:hypothetical protein n=1 Tax=Brucella anthropi TaxID=529 RepID=UPI002449C7E9|nr:hypothetical protein [Brucella anthropi]MDH0369002.1 hypothetical protein [Brucella anthropi]
MRQWNVRLLFVPAAAIVLAGYGPPKEYAQQEIEELRTEIIQCVSKLSKVKGIPLDGKASIKLVVSEGGLFEDIEVRHNGEDGNVTFGKDASDMILECEPLKSKYIGPVNFTIEFR